MTSATNRAVGPVAVGTYSDNRLGTPSKPLPAVPPKKDSKQATGTLQVEQNRSLPVRPRTAAEDERLTQLLKENVQLHVQLDICRRQQQDLERQEQAIKQEAEAEKAALIAKVTKEAEAKKAAILQKAEAEKAEIRRRGIAQCLAVLFDSSNQTIFNSISLQDASKFEFIAEKEIFNVTESALKDVVLRFLRQYKEIFKVDLGVCQSIDEKVFIKLLESAPSTNLKEVVMSRSLSPKEKAAEEVAKKAIKNFKVTFEE